MATDNQIKSKKAYLVSLKHKLKKHLQLQSASVTQVDRRWLNGFMAAGFHSGLISQIKRSDLPWFSFPGHCRSGLR